MTYLRASQIEGWSPQGAVAQLNSQESWRRISQHHRGRLGVSENDYPGIYPVDYIVSGNAILFRTGDGEKLRRIRTNQRVVFEVDGEIERRIWSVIVTGMARPLTVEPDLPQAAIATFPAWAPTEPYVYVRIDPSAISGRLWEPPSVIERD